MLLSKVPPIDLALTLLLNNCLFFSLTAAWQLPGRHKVFLEGTWARWVDAGSAASVAAVSRAGPGASAASATARRVRRMRDAV